MTSRDRREGVPRTPSRRTAVTALAAAALGAVATACRPGYAGPSADRPSGAGSPSGGVSLTIVGIITQDLARSLDFYRRLGLAIPPTTDTGSLRLRMPDGHVLFWETPPVVHDFDPGWAVPPAGDRRVVVEFGFPTAAALDTTYAALVAGGSPPRLAPFDQGGGIRYAVVEDPDQNQISLRYSTTR